MDDKAGGGGSKGDSMIFYNQPVEAESNMQPINKRFVQAIHVKSSNSSSFNAFSVPAGDSWLAAQPRTVSLRGFAISGNGSTLPAVVYARFDDLAREQSYTTTVKDNNGATMTAAESSQVPLFTASMGTLPTLRLISERGNWNNMRIRLQYVATDGTMADFTDYLQVHLELEVMY